MEVVGKQQKVVNIDDGDRAEMLELLDRARKHIEAGNVDGIAIAYAHYDGAITVGYRRNRVRPTHLLLAAITMLQHRYLQGFDD